MARAIDSEVAYQFLTEQLVKETGAFSKGVNKGLNIARSAMRNPDAIPTLTQPNEPLTLEELSLCNDPVWIKRLVSEDLSSDGWAIVEGPRCLTWRDGIPVSWGIRVWWPGSEVEDYPKYENYGKTWLAYRRPPEGEEETEA